MHLVALPQRFEMPGVGGDVDLGGSPVVGIDPVALNAGIDTVEVLPSEPDQVADVIWPVREAVRQAVGQRAVAKTTVARTGAEAASLTLD